MQITEAVSLMWTFHAEKQLFPLIGLWRVEGLTHMEFLIKQKKIVHKRKTSKAVVNLPLSGSSRKLNPRSDCVMLRETKKPKSSISDSTVVY